MTIEELLMAFILILGGILGLVVLALIYLDSRRYLDDARRAADEELARSMTRDGRG